MTKLFYSKWKKRMPILFLILLSGWLNSVNASCNTICINGNCTTNCSSSGFYSGLNCKITCRNNNCTKNCSSNNPTVGSVSIVGSGNLQTKQYNFSGFTQINAENRFDITITKAHSHHVEITADDNVFEHLNVHQKGGILYLTTENGSFSNITLQATIMMPSLEKIDLSGSSECTFSGFTSNRLELDLSGSTELKGTSNTANLVRVDMSGSSKLSLNQMNSNRLELDLSGSTLLIGTSGTTSQLTVDMSGSSELNLEKMSSSEAHLAMSGASEATITLDGTGVLTGKLSGASTLNYCGTPTQNKVTTSNQSTVVKKCSYSRTLAKAGDVIGTDFTAPDNRIDIYDFSIFMLYIRDKLIPRVDYNRDGIVDAADNDAKFLETHFDLNNDGKVDINDAKVFQAHFN
jgi:hypothetical protein